MGSLQNWEVILNLGLTCRPARPNTFLLLFLSLQGKKEEQERLLLSSTTLYIGNMSFYTTEEQVYELFNRCGDVKRVIMGLDKFRKTPCGFCFVEYPLIKSNRLTTRIFKKMFVNVLFLKSDFQIK